MSEQHVILRESNGLGTAGFVTSIVGFVTCGLLCPLGLLFSVVGLFHRPRGFAIAGVILGAFGSLFLVFFGLAIIGAVLVRKEIQKIDDTKTAFERCEIIIRKHDQSTRSMPDTFQGCDLIANEKDPWGVPIEYEYLGSGKFRFLSAGPDASWDTADDLKFEDGLVLKR